MGGGGGAYLIWRDAFPVTKRKKLTFQASIITIIITSGDHSRERKEYEKNNDYSDLQVEIARLWNKTKIVVPL